MAVRVESRWLEEEHAGGPSVRVPVFDAVANADGPSVAIIGGMHGGEYAGIYAAMQLIREISEPPAEVRRGRVLIIPVMSTRAFFARSMQLSPVDEHEVHYQWPGHPKGSYSEHLIDLVFRTVRSAQAVVDLHSGEFVQDLTPYVCVPWVPELPTTLWEASYALAACFEVPFVNRRKLAETPLALPRALLDLGIPNVWTEIGRNGLPEPDTIRLQHDGLRNLLRRFGILAGDAANFAPAVYGPRQWSVFAERSGIWWPAVHAGQHVRQGEQLGELRDIFGALLDTFSAPADAIVTYVCTSPAIDVDHHPHGYAWHRQLVQLLDLTRG